MEKFTKFFSVFLLKREGTGGINPLVYMSSKQGIVEGKCGETSVPTEFVCPLSLEVMKDPVLICTGHSYNRAPIQAWMTAGNIICPKSREVLTNRSLTPNIALRSMIVEWCKKERIPYHPNRASSVLSTRIELLIQKYTADLQSANTMTLRTAVCQLCGLSKLGDTVCVEIGKKGAIPHLTRLIISQDTLIRDKALKALSTLSICDENALLIVAGGSQNLVNLVAKGSMPVKEKATAIICNMCINTQVRLGFYQAVPFFVWMLDRGTEGGQKSSANALYLLGMGAQIATNRLMIEKLMIHLRLGDHLVEEALRIFDLITQHLVACELIYREKPMFPLLKIILKGSPTNQEHAASVLHKMCLYRPVECVTDLYAVEGAQESLQKLLVSGSPKAKENAKNLPNLMPHL